MPKGYEDVAKLFDNRLTIIRCTATIHASCRSIRIQDVCIWNCSFHHSWLGVQHLASKLGVCAEISTLNVVVCSLYRYVRFLTLWFNWNERSIGNPRALKVGQTLGNSLQRSFYTNICANKYRKFILNYSDMFRD